MASFPLPTSPASLISIEVTGGYLQSQRNKPLSQLLDETIKGYFKQLDEEM